MRNARVGGLGGGQKWLKRGRGGRPGAFPRRIRVGRIAARIWTDLRPHLPPHPLIPYRLKGGRIGMFFFLKRVMMFDFLFFEFWLPSGLF